MKFFARFISKAAVILQKRDNLKENCCINFNFNNLTIGLKNATSKKFDRYSNIALEFIIEGNFENRESFIESASINVNVILSLITLSTIRFCSSARLTNITEIIDNSPQPSTTYYLDFTSDDSNHELIHFFDVEIFNEYLTQFNVYPNKDLIFRAISWFRAGLDENEISRFVTFWFGLEVLKEIPPFTEDKWEKIEKIFRHELDNKDFPQIKSNIKERLFNGTLPLTPSNVENLKSNIIVLQKALFIGISKELEIKKEIREKLVKSIRVEETQKDLSLVLIGELDHFSPNLDYLMNNYPVLELKTNKPGIPSISQNLQKLSLENDYLFTNLQPEHFLQNERQIWTRQRLTASEITTSSIRLKDFKQDTLKINFDAGKQKTNTNEKSIIFKPWMKLLREGSSAGKICYLFFAEGKNETDNLQLFGAVCHTPAGHILFFPGFEYEYISRFNGSTNPSSESYFLIDHLTLLNGAEKYHFTGFDLEGNRLHQFDHNTQRISDGVSYWFNLNIQRKVFFEHVFRDNKLNFSCPSSISDRIKNEIKESRQDCNDYIICPIDARTDSSNAFYHFDFFIVQGDISPNYPLTSYLTPSELVKPKNIINGHPVNYAEITLPGFDGKIIIASTIISGDLADLIIIGGPQ